MSARLIIISFAISLLSCGTYRSGLSDYRGPGDYITPSDYDHERAQVQNELKQAPNYSPESRFALSWPVKNVRINRGFKPSSPKHQGLDLGGARGAPILAAHEGLVIYSGRGFRGYGKMVLVEFNDQWASLYAHLDQIQVKEGDVVKMGQTIGKMGKTGRATGVHLHFELMRDRLPIDPLQYLNDRGRVADHR